MSPIGCQPRPRVVVIGGGIAGHAVCEHALQAGEWLDVLGSHVEARAIGAAPVYSLESPCWKLEVKRAVPRLTPLAQAPKHAHAVLYPVTEDHVGLDVVWYWRRRGAREFWFRQADRNSCFCRAFFLLLEY